MQVQLVPLLAIQRELQGMARDRARFNAYLAKMLKPDRSDAELAPLVLANPMAREHVTECLDRLLAMGVETQVGNSLAKAVANWSSLPGNYRAGCVVIDDLKGGWTNRWATDYGLRRIPNPVELKSREAERFWINIPIWSSQPVDLDLIRANALAAVHRVAHVLRHGAARTLERFLVQEGRALTAGGTKLPDYPTHDLEKFQEIIRPHLHAEDMPTAISCLFGDEAGDSLGFAPLGLPPMAGLAVATWQAKQKS